MTNEPTPPPTVAWALDRAKTCRQPHMVAHGNYPYDKQALVALADEVLRLRAEREGWRQAWARIIRRHGGGPMVNGGLPCGPIIHGSREDALRLLDDDGYGGSYVDSQLIEILWRPAKEETE